MRKKNCFGEVKLQLKPSLHRPVHRKDSRERPKGVLLCADLSIISILLHRHRIFGIFNMNMNNNGKIRF
jgi:hypothetical protein